MVKVIAPSNRPWGPRGG